MSARSPHATPITLGLLSVYARQSGKFLERRPPAARSASAQGTSKPPLRLVTMTTHTAVATIHTNHGDIVINLFGDHAPKTVKNFTDLAQKGFYDGVIFHRIIPNFMIQGGDPTGTGTGGPGYNFDDEIHPELGFTQPYQLAMANAGKRPDMTGRLAGTNGSQFFITTIAPDWLNGKHTIFGEVADDASKAVVDAISAVQTGAMDRPVEDVVMTGVDIVEA